TRDTSTDRKLTLSMPSTTSSALNVTNAAQASALVSNSSIEPAGKYAPDSVARDHVKRDQAQRGSDRPGHDKVAPEREQRKHAPEHDQREVNVAPAFYPHRMDN